MTRGKLAFGFVWLVVLLLSIYGASSVENGNPLLILVIVGFTFCSVTVGAILVSYILDNWNKEI